MKNLSGVIYIITNPSFPEYVKIWYADDFQRRLNSLNWSSATPFAFRAYAVYDTDIKLSDKEIHKLIDWLNPNLRSIDNFDWKKRIREFYAMSPEDAYQIFVSIAKISWTLDRLHLLTPDWKQIEEEQQAKEIKEEDNIRKEQQWSKWQKFKLWYSNLHVWDTIVFINDENKTCKVHNLIDEVEYEWTIYKLKDIAKFFDNWQHEYYWSWSRWFTYNWKRLWDIRHELNRKLEQSISNTTTTKESQNINEENENKQDEKSIKYQRFRFSFCNLWPWDIITFVKDENKKCKIVDEFNVEYDWKIYQLKDMAKYFDNWQRWRYEAKRWFTYNWKKLWDIKKELYPIEKSERKSPFKFSDVNLKTWDILTFVEDNTKTVTIVDDKNVEYNWNKYSLSRLTKIFLQDESPHRWTNHFMYNWRKISEVYDNSETF